jgi:HlyD family secretion protein
MNAKWVKRAIGLAVLAAIVAVAVYALRPAPVAVDIAVVDRGPLSVTIDEEGVARIRDVFRVAVPVSGELERLPVEVGDRVEKNVTIVGSILPAAPAILDIRTRRELEAMLGAAQAAVAAAEATLRQAETSQQLAEADMERAQQLAARQTISRQALERASAAVNNAAATVEQARAQLELRRREQDSVKARLIQPGQTLPSERDLCCVPVRAPLDGVVLSVLSEGGQVLAAGTPFVELGDPRNLEIAVQLLSSDAVLVKPSQVATIEEWGGRPLNAQVRRIEPAAVTKISALGIEEQRVNAILDLTDPPEVWERLGHDFRVMVRVTVWQAGNAVRMPLGALFRSAGDYAVFKLVDGRAVLTRVMIDHRNRSHAEVTTGVTPGDTVILHPSDRVQDGVRVTERPD